MDEFKVEGEDGSALVMPRSVIPLDIPALRREYLYDAEFGCLIHRESGEAQALYASGGAYLAFWSGGHNLLVHRVIWALVTGTQPPILDHINGIPTDNRIENLRPASRSENARNCGISKRNTSGAKGVTWNKTGQNWRVRVRLNYLQHHVGYFDALEEATVAAKEARIRLHGDFARHD